MTLAALAAAEREVVCRSMEATLQLFQEREFQTRLGITPKQMRGVLNQWPNVDDTTDGSDACLAINNSLNDLLNGVGISDAKAIELTGADRAEMSRIYLKWAKAQGWPATGIR